jgi:hypothetical protein
MDKNFTQIKLAIRVKFNTWQNITSMMALVVGPVRYLKKNLPPSFLADNP